MQPPLTAAVLLLFCVAALPAATVAKPATPVSDTAIEQNIRARIARSKIAKNNFQVKVQNGTAILTGRTDVLQHKGVATRFAKAAGVRRVDNRIEINEAARAAAVSNLEKARRRGALKRGEVIRPQAP